MTPGPSRVGELFQGGKQGVVIDQRFWPIGQTPNILQRMVDAVGRQWGLKGIDFLLQGYEILRKGDPLSKIYILSKTTSEDNYETYTPASIS